MHCGGVRGCGWCLRLAAHLRTPDAIAGTYLESQVALRSFGEVSVRWTGETTANMAEAALHVLGAPRPRSAFSTPWAPMRAGVRRPLMGRCRTMTDSFARAAAAGGSRGSGELASAHLVPQAVATELDRA